MEAPQGNRSDLRVQMSYFMDNPKFMPTWVKKKSKDYRYLNAPEAIVYNQENCHWQPVIVPSGGHLLNVVRNSWLESASHVHINVSIKVDNLDIAGDLEAHRPKVTACHLEELKTLLYDMLLLRENLLTDVCITVRLYIQSSSGIENLNHLKRRLYAANIAKFNMPSICAKFVCTTNLKIIVNPWRAWILLDNLSKLQACRKAPRLSEQLGFTGNTHHKQYQLIEEIDVYDIDVSATDDLVEQYFEAGTGHFKHYAVDLSGPQIGNSLGREPRVSLWDLLVKPPASSYIPPIIPRGQIQDAEFLQRQEQAPRLDERAWQGLFTEAFSSIKLGHKRLKVS